MVAIAAVVFVALNFVEAGYGMMISNKWGLAINNKLGWFFMELPVFIVMIALLVCSDRTFWKCPAANCWVTPFVFFVFFEAHYFRRSLIFPFRLKGKNKMPITIMLLGIIFNLCNALMQGGWIFYLAPKSMYTLQWLYSPQFIIGTIIFFGGMTINAQSDKIIRDLRHDGDTRHYLPEKGMFKYVTGAHYFGEVIEWVGFAILTWSISGAVFAIWTFANLVPRAKAIYLKYQKLFGKEVLKSKKLKRIFPYIY
ncbi:MAG: DUF1295 domain-containing protein [Bacteroidales bacterium]|nr:DUF1295 domain-containing protein [Bacteroidales bacterium]